MKISDLVVTSFVAVGALLLARSPAIAQPSIEKSVEVPNSTIVTEISANGVQFYTCAKRVDDPSQTQTEWKFSGPLASLTINGVVVGMHFGASDGPHWELFDGSKVVGQLTGDVPSSNPNNIDQYRLRLKYNNGTGILGKATHIVRDDLNGGVKPTRPCTSDNLGEKTGVYYTGTYRALMQLGK